MSDIEFFGKIKPLPFISLRKEEELRIKEIKERTNKAKIKSTEIHIELTYERDAQKDY